MKVRHWGARALLLAAGCISGLLGCGGGSKTSPNGIQGDQTQGGLSGTGVSGPSTGGTGAGQTSTGTGTGTAGTMSASTGAGTGGRSAPSGASGSGAAGTQSTAGSGDVHSGTGGAATGTGGMGNASGGTGAAAGAGASGSGGKGGSAGRGADGCAPAPSDPVGWAFAPQSGMMTTGGEGGPTVSATSLSELSNAVKGSNTQIVEIKGSISGNLSIGSNKTVIGCAGAEFKGHISMDGSVNVIVRNLKVVGYNCTDNPSDCSGGADAITVQKSAHHLWFDHDDISDGSDGNLDITHGSDFITISWTKFHYSGRRTDPAGAAGGHQFSNLIGHSDSNSNEDTGHLNVTFHHDWWADNVVERMPRTRFGKIHVFNNLYTASGNDYCVGVGISSNVLTENNVFIGVAEPIRIGFSEPSSSYGSVRSAGNLYMGTSGPAPMDNNPGSVFTPSYTYTPDATSGLEAAIRAGAGPQ